MSNYDQRKSDKEIRCRFKPVEHFTDCAYRMKTTLTVDEHLLSEFTAIAARHDMKIECVTLSHGDTVKASLNGDHLSIAACTAFYVEWERTKNTMLIVPVAVHDQAVRRA